MCAFPYHRPGGFGGPMSRHGPQAPGAYPWRRDFRGRGRGNPVNLGDLVDVAKKRAMSMPNVSEQGFADGIEVLRHCLMDTLSDDPVFAIHSALTNINVSHLHLEFECDFLCTMGKYPLFTGVLCLSGQFIVRGLGASKDSCKVDTFRKAQNLLITSTTNQIMMQEDIGEHALCQEVHNMYAESPESFYEMLQESSDGAQDYQESSGYWEMPQPSFLGMKRPYEDISHPHGAYGPPFRPPHGYRGPSLGAFHGPPGPSPLLVGPPWKDPNSLAASKINLVMKQTDGLEKKLVKLKQLLKEEGITKLHIVPKIDYYAQKVAIHIVNVVRFSEPVPGACGHVQPVLVEIYFDNVLMAVGRPDIERINAVMSAYQILANTLSGTTNVTELVQTARQWQPFNKMDPDICDVLIKRPGEDSGTMLSTNLANMTQMMQAGPDFTVSIDRVILTEHEVDKEEHCFKMLELSCTRNNVLLECEITRMPNGTFSCSMSANGKGITQRSGQTKTHAKKKCSEAIMNDLLKNNDHIMVAKGYIGRVITKSELVEEARNMFAQGLPPSNYVSPTKNKPAVSDGEKDKKKLAKDRSDSERENLPENVALRPLMPYMAAAYYKILDDYYERITLEDMVIDTTDMCKSQYEMVNVCAVQMGFRVITKIKHPDCAMGSLLRRTVKAQEMAWICQLNGGSSGRFELKNSAHPKSAEELAKLKANHLAQHKALVKARNETNAEKELKMKPLSVAGAVADTISGGLWSQPEAMQSTA